MTQEELQQGVLRLRLSEMETRDLVIGHLHEIHRQRLWKAAGHKSFQKFCEMELSYEPAEARDLAIAVGAILTTESLSADDVVVQGRIEKLKAWRKEKAMARGVAAYRILSNRTLLAVAKANPRTMDELLSVPGVGEKKIAAFGLELLTLNATV